MSTRVEQLPRLRGRIDRRELRPPEALGFYTALVRQRAQYDQAVRLYNRSVPTTATSASAWPT